VGALAHVSAPFDVLAERGRFILSGPYPASQQWRLAVVVALFAGLYAASAVPACWRRGLLLAWLLIPAGAVVIMRGGVLGLVPVPTDVWGGLPLTLLIATVGFAIALPAGTVLALGRRSELPVLRLLSGLWVELLRAVPLVTLLFMASVMFPLFVPARLTVDKLVRAEAAFALVLSAYVAEVVRGGLAGIPAGQYDAAASLGLGYWSTALRVTLPQALRASIPALVNTFVGFFKDTSLVAIIGIFDLLGAARAVVVDPRWLQSAATVYLFVAAVYFLFCYVMSHGSRRLEAWWREREAL
jgi:general L-amino acid transport system permease protein